MTFVVLTRPDDTPVAVAMDDVVFFAPVLAGGPLKTGTRLQFKNNLHQDVKEAFAEVAKKFGAT